MALAPSVGIEHGLAFEHGTGNGKQAVGDGAQDSGMTVAASSQVGVFGSACDVVLEGDVGPMVDGVLEAVASGQTADDDNGLSETSGDGGDA